MIKLELAEEEVKVVVKALENCLEGCREGGKAAGCSDCEKLEKVLKRIKEQL